MSENLTMTSEQFNQMMAMWHKATIDGMKAVAETIVRGDPEVAAEKADLKRRKLENQKALAADAEKNRQTALQMIMQCSHKDEHGKWSIGGQPNNDGKVRLMCVQCRGIWEVEVSESNMREIVAGNIVLWGSAPPKGIEPITPVA